MSQRENETARGPARKTLGSPGPACQTTGRIATTLATTHREPTVTQTRPVLFALAAAAALALTASARLAQADPPGLETLEIGAQAPDFRLPGVDGKTHTLGEFAGAKVLVLEENDAERPAAYAQFGPLSAYPRALRLRELYSQLPDAPLPAVITCIATTADAHQRGLARRLVEAVCDDLAGRGFFAVEAYPEANARPHATSAATTAFWVRAGFQVAVDDERFPVVRREL